MSSAVWRKTLTVNEHFSKKKRAKMARYAAQQLELGEGDDEEGDDDDEGEEGWEGDFDLDEEEEHEETVAKVLPTAGNTSRGRRNSRRYAHMAKKGGIWSDDDVVADASTTTKKSDVEHV
jgi:hypothetical protein